MQFHLKVNQEFLVYVFRKVCHFGHFTSVLKTHFKEVLDVLFSYSVIRKNDVVPACKIWISVGMNDVNYDAGRSKGIYSCFEAD